MELAVYTDTLLAILRDHTAAAVDRLRAIDGAMPLKAQNVQILVHLPQDAEGLFSVVVHLGGPDLHVLNKAIADHRTLFDVAFVGAEVRPPVPLFDPFDQPFPVNDAIVTIAMIWLKEVWTALGGWHCKLPVTVAGTDSAVRSISLSA